MTSPTDINQFRQKTHDLQENAWFCGCGGGCTWILHENGNCICAACHCISTVIKVARTNEGTLINRAMIHPYGYAVIPLLRGDVSVRNDSPDIVVVTVDRATK